MTVDTTSRGARPLAIVLGLNEIASAIAVGLHNTGYAIIMAHDPTCPVMRRSMSFYDVLYEGEAVLGGCAASSVDSLLAARFQLRSHAQISVTRLDLSELLVIRDIDVLIDARLQQDAVTPQLRKLARFTIGIGSGFVAGESCDAMVASDIAVGAAPAKDRTLVVRSPAGGRWHTPLDIGMRVYKDFLLGHLGSLAVRAPADGVLRGIARDDIDIPCGAELIEICTGTGARRWWGLDQKGVRIAEEVQRALQSLGTDSLVASAPGARLRLVHSR